MLVELKDGDTLNGHLLSCDTWMNLVLKEVVQTSAEGDKFFRLEEAYVRGNNIKYIRVSDDIVEALKEQQQRDQAARAQNQGRGDHQRGGFGGRGDRGGRGRGRGPRGGRGRGS